MIWTILWWFLLVGSVAVHGFRAYLVRTYAKHNAARDAARFAADTRDRFRTVFHRQQWLEQAGVLVGLAVVIWSPIWFLCPWSALALTLTWSIWNGADFNRTFTPALNLACKKKAFYVSQSAHAAYFDRWVLRLAIRAGVEPERMMASVLNMCLKLSQTLAGVTVAAVIIVGVGRRLQTAGT